jgi:hypothetical protein
MDRALFTGGPAYLTWNGVTFQMHDDWTVDDSPEHFDVVTNLQGRVARGISDVMAKISFTPIAFGASIATLFTKLFPYQPSMRGQLIFPSTDLPAVIQTQAGRSITFSSAALTKMPEITFAPDKVFFGRAELTCLIKNNAASSDADAFVTVANSAYTEPALNPLDILFDLYTVTYGTGTPAAPFNSIETDEGGVRFAPTVDLTPRKTARRGTYNMMIDGVSAEVRFTPENITEADWYDVLMKLDGTGVTRGKLRGVLGDQLTVTGSGTGKARLTIPLAAAEDGGVRFGSDSRVSEVTMAAHRKANAGVLQPLFTLGVVA